MDGSSDANDAVASFSPHIQHAIAALIVLAMGGLLFSSMRNESPTTDEGMHLTRGVAFYWGQGASLSFAHPPLGNAFAALPIALSEPARDLTDNISYQRSVVEAVASRLLSKDYEARREWFFQARSMVAMLTLGLGVYLYFFARTMFGPAAALLALFFYALHPTLIAHGRLMTTDMPVTVAMIVSFGELILYLDGRARWHALTAALMAGVALSTKYTALLLLPLHGGLVLGCALLGVGRYAGKPRRRVAQNVLALGLLFACMALLTINAAYGFHRSGLRVDRILSLPEPRSLVVRDYEGTVLEKQTFLRHLPDWVRIPVPYTYLFGLISVHTHDRDGHITAFMGKIYRRGHPAYFPVLLAIKTPTLVLVGLMSALWVFFRRRGDVSLAAAALGFYCILILLLVTRASINIGVRHILPMIPALTLLAALGSIALYRAVSRPALRNGVAACLLGAHVWGLTWAFPDYLSDFNALVGGREGGQKVSIIGEEWDQDLVRLGAALQARGITSLRFNRRSITSHMELQRFGVKIRPLRCGADQPLDAYLAVSARERARDMKGCYDWLDELTPIIDINGHVWVYSMRDRWTLTDRSEPRVLTR